MAVPTDQVYLVDPRCCGCSAISVRPFEWYVDIESDWDETIEHVQVGIIGGQQEWHRTWQRRLSRAWNALCGRVTTGFELMSPKAVDDLIAALERARADAWPD